MVQWSGHSNHGFYCKRMPDLHFIIVIAIPSVVHVGVVVKDSPNSVATKGALRHPRRVT
jgi:hypothetical protein